VAISPCCGRCMFRHGYILDEAPITVGMLHATCYMLHATCYIRAHGLRHAALRLQMHRASGRLTRDVLSSSYNRH
jgi:hypothetical protein